MMAPIVKMHTLGSDFIPEPIHAGGLRYHGMSPLVSLLKEQGLIEAVSVHQRACFEAGVQFARAEGILPAPESTHAIKVADRRGARGEGGRRGAGDPVQPVRPRPLRPVRYERYLQGALEDYEYPAEKVAGARRPAAGRLTGQRSGVPPEERRCRQLACPCAGRQVYTLPRRSARCSPRSGDARAAAR